MSRSPSPARVPQDGSRTRQPGRRGALRRAVLLAGLVAAAAAAAAAIAVWRAPLAALEWAGRAALRWQGFERREAPGPRGPVVWFQRGSGPPLVFLHGIDDQAGSWARVAPVFAATHQVAALDLAGHGESAPGDGPLTLDDLVSAAEIGIRGAGGGRPAVLVGNSFGGFLSLVHATRRPEDVAGLVLVGAAVIEGDDAEAARAARVLLPSTREEARRAFETIMSPRSPRVPGFVLDDFVRRAPTSPLARLLAAMPRELDGYLSDDRLASLTVPVEMIWGEDDRLLTVAYARRAAARMPGARLEIIPACGHIPQRECPDAFAARLRAALDRIAARAPRWR
jgi:pimeloyl-ACP methyl ester carboxylesterase